MVEHTFINRCRQSWTIKHYLPKVTRPATGSPNAPKHLPDRRKIALPPDFPRIAKRWKLDIKPIRRWRPATVRNYVIVNEPQSSAICDWKTVC